VQRVYDEERTLDETMTVLDGDTVLVPRGYHAVSAPPGYDLYTSMSWPDRCASGKSKTTPTTSGYLVETAPERKRWRKFRQDLLCGKMSQGIAA
jgi:hypothetical protein